jgi:hypothetical protein
MWTKTPPTEPGVYWVIFHGSPTIAEMEASPSLGQIQRDWYVPLRGRDGDESFTWFWSKRVEPPLTPPSDPAPPPHPTPA